MGIKLAKRIGLPALCAAGMEKKILKVPEHEIVVAFAGPEVVAAPGVDLEKHLAVHQQCEKIDSRKTVLPPKPTDFFRFGKRGDRARNFGIANPKQRAGARRFQNHLIAAPSQIRKP